MNMISLIHKDYRPGGTTKNRIIGTQKEVYLRRSLEIDTIEEKTFLNASIRKTKAKEQSPVLCARRKAVCLTTILMKASKSLLMGKATLKTSQSRNSCAKFEKIHKQMAYHVIFLYIMNYKNCL